MTSFYISTTKVYITLFVGSNKHQGKSLSRLTMKLKKINSKYYHISVSMARRNKQTLLYIIIGLLVIFALYSVYGKNKKEDSEKYTSTKKVREDESGEEMELLPTNDGTQKHEDPEDDFQLLGVAPEQPSHNIGFGMGPGLYGSGRHTSEMVGN